MDDLFSRFFGEEALPAFFQREFSPVIDISETDKGIQFKAEISGSDPEDGKIIRSILLNVRTSLGD